MTASTACAITVFFQNTSPSSRDIKHSGGKKNLDNSFPPNTAACVPAVCAFQVCIPSPDQQPFICIGELKGLQFIYISRI